MTQDGGLGTLSHYLGLQERDESMHYRALGRTGWKVSEISFGAWAIGGSWGQVSDEESMAALHKAIDCGVNFYRYRGRLRRRPQRASDRPT
jgi:hypothetical protein